MSADSDKDQALVSAAKVALDRSVEEIDAAMLARLRMARQGALAVRPSRFPRLVLAGGFATASVVILASLLWLFAPNGTGLHPGHEEFELLTAAESLEFYENLEFYGWLAENERAS